MNNRLSGTRVLVVEDEYFLADDIATALQQAGAEIAGPIRTMAEALSWLESKSPDLVVLDINLEGQSGIEIADILKTREIPFVFATGYDRTAIPERHRDVPHWEKPFDIGELVRELGQWAGASSRPCGQD